MRIFLTLASLLGGLAVVAGAFGSHALRGSLSDRALGIFETGVRYQMYHALALLLVALLLDRSDNSPLSLTVSGYAFTIGILIFSGSLYALSLTNIQWLGAITPLGGVALILGWLYLAVSVWTSKSSH